MLHIAYEYVLAIAKHRNITKAAAELYITQPALTKYLNRLEAELGVRLFERSPASVTPTPAGQIFLEKAEEIVALEGVLLNSIRSTSINLRGNLSIGITPEMSATLLPYILPKFMAAYPKVHISIEEGTNELLISMVNQRKLEFAIIPVLRSKPLEMFEKLMEEPVILVMPATHPIAQTFDLTVNSPYTPYYLEAKKIASENFILCSPSLGVGEASQAILNYHHINPHILLRLGRNEAAVKLVSAGLGMTFTSSRTPLRMDLQGPLAYFSLDNPVFTRYRGIFHLKDRPLSEPAKVFTDMLKQIVSIVPEFRPPVCQLLFPPVV